MTTSPSPQQFPSGPTLIDASAIVDFSRGVNEERPDHTDPEHPEFRGHPMCCARVVIPASAAPLFDPSLGVDLRRIVHAGIELNFGEAIRAGDQLTTVATLLGIDEKPTGKLVRISFVVTRQDGSQVADGETRYFSRGKAPAESGESKESGGSVEDAAPVAESLIEAVVPTRENQSLLYAEGSGDSFPIHTNEDFARSVGLPGIIMHGMCSLTLCLSPIIEAAAGGDTSRLQSVCCRFGAMAFPGQDLQLRAADQGTEGIAFEAYDPTGKPVIREGRVVLT